MFLYLVDWGNGFVGGFDKQFHQEFNSPQSLVFSDLKLKRVEQIKIITPHELDELRGHHKPTLQEYLGA